MSNFKTGQITVNTQSSIRIESTEGTVIYLDPLGIEGNPQDADLILVTHSHHDHFSMADIAKIQKNSTKLVVPSSMKGDMENSISKHLGADISSRLAENVSISPAILMRPKRLKRWTVILR